MLLQLISALGSLKVLSAYGLIQGGVWRELNAGNLALKIVGSDSFSWSLREPSLDRPA
ncbi:MAG: hypothetical protein ACREI1_08285 [Nitrospiraceae bacterium]